ncbi:MAG: ATP phosphoribosyltransferase regulatory subunit, partial [Lachnospiraceae bacterium]
TVYVFEKAEAIVNNERSLKAVKRLRELYDVLQLYGIEKYVSFDFGMLSKYQYYTGMIFKVYTYGVGDAIVKGGRYDSLLQKFGKDAPAVGFVILIDDLMQALSRQNTTVSLQNKRILVVYEKEAFQKALTFAKERRDMGYTVEMIQKENEDCSKYEAFSTRIASSELIYIKD